MQNKLWFLPLLFFVNLALGQSKAYFDQEQKKIEKAVQIEQEITQFIEKNIDTYQLKMPDNDSISYYSKKFAAPNFNKRLEASIKEDKKNALRTLYFSQHPENEVYFKSELIPPSDVCTNSGFEDGVTGYTFYRYVVTPTPRHLGYSCILNISQSQEYGPFQNFTAALSTQALNQFGQFATFVSPQNEPLLATYGVFVNTVIEETRSVKLNPTETNDDFGNQTAMTKTFLLDGETNISFKYLQVGNAMIGNDHFSPSFRYRLYKVSDNTIVTESCNQLDPYGSDNCLYTTVASNASGNLVVTRNTSGQPGWVCVNIDVAGLTGNYRLEFLASDCQERGHFSTVYIDDVCTETDCPSTYGSLAITPPALSCPTQPITICGTITWPAGYTITPATGNNIYMNVWIGTTFITSLVMNVAANATTFCFPPINPSIFGSNSGVVNFRVFTSARSTCGNVPDNISLTDNDYSVSFDHCCDYSRTISNSTPLPVNQIQAAYSITASNTLGSVGSAGIYEYRAGNNVTLTTGFHAISGSDFHAKIENCPAVTRMSHNEEEPIVQYDFDSVIKSDSNQMIAEKPVAIYPNPTSGLVTVAIKEGSIIRISVSGTDGMEIWRKSIDKANACQVDLSNFQKGLYFIIIETDEGKIFTEKMLKK